VTKADARGPCDDQLKFRALLRKWSRAPVCALPRSFQSYTFHSHPKMCAVVPSSCLFLPSSVLVPSFILLLCLGPSGTLGEFEGCSGMGVVSMAFGPLGQLKRYLPYQRQEDVELYIEACRIAGMPE
jgi:hypothetical protein